ncbi:MAG: chromosome segregation protein SMC [Deltaproteobacteria bacterium]|nr:chromosome segregation protein SMC [Deltaproteobacteria bacterium]
MRIKRLEIQGFKSFADRTIVEFQSGITGIVGPNGCGKSNVVDSIRWVMGEMSAKHLRGREMQDVIFAGTEKRNPAGMAEVTLVMSNEDGLAPTNYAGYSEIAITRRLFRSGDSEYLINKVTCRLRDIYDLFLGTGVGTKAYSIVEQGQIGQIVNAKPEDRRRIIEEAGGISKFKARKEAALRKMEAAQANLLRLNDILSELTRQIASLDRQAKKAEKYKILKEELRSIECHLATVDYQLFSTEIEAGEASLSSLSENESTFSLQLSQLETDVENLRLTLTQEEQEISSLQERLYEKNNLINLNEQAIQYKTREVQNVVERESVLLREIEDIKEKSKNLESDLNKINEEHLNIDLKVAQTDETLTLFQKQLSEKEAQLLEVDRRIDLFQHEILKLVQSLSEAASKQEWIGRQKIDLKGRIGKNQAEIEEIDRQLSQWVQKRNSFESSLSEVNQFKLGLSNQSGSLSESIDREKQEQEILKAELSQLKEQCGHKRARLSSLEEIQKNFEGYQDGVRHLMLKRSSREDLQEIYGTVADIIETESRYQMAVGAVLGDKLQYVVVKTPQSGLQAIEYLKTESVGRSSFVPMEIRSYDSDDSFPSAGQEGVLGPLKEFVSVRGDYHQVGDYLFRDVWLIENLNRAIQIWNSNGHRKTLVTLDGEVVDPHGVVSGGTPENQANGLLEKKREIKDLIEEVKVLESKVRVKEEEFRRSETRLSQFQHALENLKKDSHGEDLKLLNLEKDLSHLKSEIDRLNTRRNAVSLEISNWIQEEQDLERELSDWVAQELNWTEEKKLKEEACMAAKLDEAEQHQAVDALKEEFTKSKIEADTIHEKKAQIDKELKRLIEIKQSYSTRQEEALRQVSTGNQQVAQLKQEIVQSEEILKVLIVEVQDLNASLVALRESFEKNGQDIKEKELMLREVRRQHDEVKVALNSLLVRLTEVRGKLQFLKEQIFERYHTDIALLVPEFQEKPLENREAMEMALRDLKERQSKMGEVNLGAISEYEELKTRHEFLNQQYIDLNQSLEALARTIHKINRSTKKRFLETFEAINQQFEVLFPKVFQGGRAKLMLTDEANILESGVEIVAQPPGKKLQSISLLSGGEKALTAVSLIFSVFLFKPSPFCILDEVDAPLDDANVDRYNNLIREMIDRSQFILITHNKRTMEMADLLYGVTMEEAGVSKTVSVKLN